MTSPVYASFEDVYKTAYSHGLEAIYALENVDIKTVRRLSEDQTPQPILGDVPKSPLLIPETPRQLEFDFGEEYRSWIEPFVLNEPIQVLGLPKLAEKCLVEHGKILLRHLHGVDLRAFVFFKGMGQSHLDELQQKLLDYLSAHPAERCDEVDYASWLRTITAALNRKKICVYLESFELFDLLTLSPVESIEVKRLSLEQRLQWREGIVTELREPAQELLVKQGIQRIVNVFIRPWVRRRQGFTTQQEIQERLQHTARQPSIVPFLLDFLSATYYEERYPLNDLFLIEDGLFFVDRASLDSYQAVVNQAMTYFYKKGIFYGLKELTAYLIREFAIGWKGFPPGFIEKVLKYCPYFSVRKGDNGGHLIVERSNTCPCPCPFPCPD
jgi:hypothetical protein